MDFEQEVHSGSGQFFWPVCRTLSRIMCKKNFTKIFTKLFSRTVQSQKLECRCNIDIFLPKHHFWCLVAQKKAKVEFYETDKTD